MSAPTLLEYGAREDEMLVRECLNNNNEAWSKLVDKYRRFVFSIPVRYGIPRDHCEDIFQNVWETVLEELPTLREPRAFSAWLKRTATNKCHHFRLQQSRSALPELDPDRLEGEPQSIPEFSLEQKQTQATLHGAIEKLPAGCRELVRSLFFKHPPLPYQELARKLGVNTGAIGPTRQRCLEKLRRSLEQGGWR